jgi:5'(3')-deoxyribonucleotidase
MNTKNKKITIIVDQDSTLVDIVTPWLKHINLRLNATVKKKDIVQYDMFQVLQDMGIEKQKAATVFDIFADENVNLYNESDLEPTFDPIFKCMVENRDVNWKLFTKSASSNMTNTKEYWLCRNKITKYFDTIFIDEITGSEIITSDKAVAGDILIDDHRQYCNSFIKKNPNGIALQIKQPWNKRFEDTEQIITVDEHTLYDKLTNRITELRRLNAN